MGRVEQGAIGRFLQVHAMVHLAQELDDGPLVLLIAAGGSPDHPGLPAALRKGGAQSGARPLARRQACGQTLFKPEHLCPGGQTEAQFRDRG